MHDAQHGCANVRQRVRLLIDLREIEEAARLAQLRLQRKQDDETVTACRHAADRALDAKSMLLSTGATPLDHLGRWESLLRSPALFFRGAASRDMAAELPGASFRIVYAIGDKYINRRLVHTDADADRTWAAIQAEYAESDWNALLKRCIVPPMFGEASPLQNLPGRTHLRVALVFCIHANGGKSKRHGRLLPRTLHRAVVRLARSIRKCERLMSGR